MKIYRSVIIGCGFIAGLHDNYNRKGYILSHAAMYQENKRTELVAVCDINDNLELFADTWKINNKYTSYQKMIEKINPDIVSICTPFDTHTEILDYLARQTDVKAIFCEKPLGIDILKTKRVFVDLHKKVFYMNFLRTWDTSIDKVFEDVSTKKISNIIFHHSKGIRQNLCHIINILIKYLGKPCKYKILKIKRKVNDDYIADVVIEYKNFNVYIFENYDLEGNYFSFEILTDKGRYRTEQNGFEIMWNPFKQSKYYKGYKWISSEGKKIKSGITVAMKLILESIISDIDKNIKRDISIYYETFRITEELYSMAVQMYER